MGLGVPASPTTRTSLADLYNTQFITTLWRNTPRDPLVGFNMVKRIPLTLEEANSLTYQVPIVEDLSGVTAVAQPNLAPEDAMETDQATITGQRYALSTYVADDTPSKVLRATMVAAEKLRHAIMDFWHRAFLALGPSFDNSQGDATTENTLDNWDLVTQNFRAQIYDPGRLWAIMNPDGVRDLRQDLVTNAAALYGAAYGDRAASELKNPRPGLFSTFDGFEIFESHDTAVGDTTGWTNVMGVSGELAGIEFPVWMDLTPAMQRDERRFGTWLIASIIAGAGIVAQHNLRAFITRT